MASCTCTCKIKCVPPCKSRPSLMLSEKFDLIPAQDLGGKSGRPTRPITQARMTAAMKSAFHLRFEFMASTRSGLQGCGLFSQPDTLNGAVRLFGGLPFETQGKQAEPAPDPGPTTPPYHLVADW